jgi:hypothetical protein
MDNLRINGFPGSSLTGSGIPSLGLPGALRVSSSRNFALSNLTVNGFTDTDPNTSSQVISMSQSGGTVQDCILQGAEGNGITVLDNSSLRIESSTVQNNGGNGINVQNVSSVTVNDSTVQNNGSSGINVNNLSSATLFNTMVLNNTGNGVNISNSSTASLTGDRPTTPTLEKVEIANNGGAGISIGGLSNLSGTGAHLIHNNRVGIIVGGGSNANLSGHSATQKLEIYMNGSQGVLYIGATGGLGTYVKVYQNNQSPPSTLPPGEGAVLCGVCAIRGSTIALSETEISANPGPGLFVSSNSLGTGRGITATGNLGDGVRVERASGVQFLPPATGPSPGTPTNISGNSGGSVNCDSNLSWVSGDLTGIAKPIKCTEIK